MNTGRLFWGGFFLGTGLLLLLDQMGVLRLGMYSLWRYWPVILILWGLATLATSRGLKLVVVMLAALFLATLAYGILSFAWLRPDQADHDADYSETFVEPYEEGIVTASFSFDAAAGSFTIDEPTSDLIHAAMGSNFGQYDLGRESSGDNERLTLSLDGHHSGWLVTSITNRGRIRLNANPVWDMNFDVGAASVNFDLSQYKIERVRMDAGAASVRMKLGALFDETRVRFDAGLSSVRLSIPREAGCEINLDSGLSSKRFEGFKRVASGKYQTENFDWASRKIIIDADVGLSSFKVVRY